MTTSPVSVDQHLARVCELAQPPHPQLVPVQEAHGHYLADPVQARQPIPSFHNSAMDGFLVHEADLSGPAPWTVPVVGEVAAGGSPQELAPHQALRIMTGAPICGDIDSLRVVPSELTNAQLGPSQLPEQVTIHELPGKRHIRLRGEVITPGTEIAAAHTLVDAGTLAFLLTAGVTEVSVYRRPRVAVISSGDELISTANPASTRPASATIDAAGSKARGSSDEQVHYRIVDSNGPMVANLLAEHGPVDIQRFHVGDGVEKLIALFDELTSSVAPPLDLIVTTGGISQGAFDVVKAAATQSPNADFWFGNAAQRPGSPQGAGLWNGVAVVTLPGNPVAAYVSATVYALAALYILQGRTGSSAATTTAHGDAQNGTQNDAQAQTQENTWWPHRAAQLAAHRALPRPRPGKTQLVPVRIEAADSGLVAVPTTVGKPGSHFVSALTEIAGLAIIPQAEYAEQNGPTGMVTVLGWSR
ncbi:molybdopterin molybdotransferase MoeA [Corynebacterium propinquum]